jgi:hypothetical protein
VANLCLQRKPNTSPRAPQSPKNASFERTRGLYMQHFSEKENMFFHRSANGEGPRRLRFADVAPRPRLDFAARFKASLPRPLCRRDGGADG